MKIMTAGTLAVIIFSLICLIAMMLKLAMLFWFTFGILVGMILLIALILFTVEDYE